MREFTTPRLVDVGAEENLTTPVFRNAAQQPGTITHARKDGDRWVDVTASQFAAEVAALAKGLLAAGIEAGDRIGIMSRTRYEWTLTDYAILAAGAVTVPIYETSSPDQVAWILSDSAAVAVVLETDDHRKTLDAVADGLPTLQHIWQVEAGDLHTLAGSGAGITDAEAERRRSSITGATLATIIYTSGTTGRPKGCELTHHNFLFDAETTISDMRDVFAPGSTTLLFLPLAHVFARLIQIGCVCAGVRLGHTADVRNLLSDLAGLRPTFVLAVPRVFEKIYNGAGTKARASGNLTGRIFDQADAVAVRYSKALDSGGPGRALRTQHRLFDRLVYAKIRAQLGGEVRYAISGGAPLGGRLSHFFRGIGLIVLEGYGLTECAAGATVNRPPVVRIGTVGRPMPDVTVRIGDDNEVLIKGANIFRGYWHDDAATKEALEDDGWLHTGDLGTLDEDGYLTITGRKKELIVTAGGKNVSPAALEDTLRAHPLISQCMVVGDQRPYVAALITIDDEHLSTWKAEHGKPADATVADLRDDADLTADIDAAVASANRVVSRAEGIRRYRVLTVDFTEEGGQLTPTLKLKRRVVAAEFAAEIDALYAG